LDNAALSETFRAWNGGELESFLFKITADIFAENDPDGDGQLVDVIVDSAGQKGTGRWTSIEALKRGVNTSIMTAACNARVMSNLIEREKFSSALHSTAPRGSIDDRFVEDVRRSLYLGKIAAYAQGFALYRAASANFNWNLDLGRIASIFRAGCIIQARFLNKITDAYRNNPALDNLMLDEFFMSKIVEGLESLRRTVALGVEHGVPIPALVNALEYIDALRADRLGANLIQAQRDYFGAHTFKRVDRGGSFHHEWQH
ncbi:MAG: NADP-dependent phosphogluconate dehydrogenase, partial [Selenomonadaceae bacterium]|nr:NADP-dependent phosphogluconate dehydrogenase [Selenomonadaceae bacterium]